MVFITALAVLLTESGGPSESRQSDVRCGSYCLYVALSGLDLPVGDFQELEERLGPPPPDGYTFGQLEAAARSYGAQTLGVQTSFENLRTRMERERFACLAHLASDHYLLITDLDDRSATIIDPPRRTTIPTDTLGAIWDRKALLISPNALASEESLPQSGPVGWWPLVIAVGALGAVAILGRLAIRRRAARMSVLLAALLTSNLPGCGTEARESVQSAPRIQFIGETRLDLGDVLFSNEALTAEFRFINRGDADLEILDLVASCTCAGGCATHSVVGPGEQAAIVVDVRPNRGGAQTTGIRLQSNDPLEPYTDLTVSWETVTPVQPASDSVEVGNVTVGTTVTRRVPLIQEFQLAQPVRVATVRSSTAELSAEIQSSADALSKELLDEVVVHVTGRNEWGPSGGHVTIEFEGGWTGRLTVPVTWTVVGSIRAVPVALFFGSGVPSGRILSKINVECVEAVPIVVVGISSDPPIEGFGWTVARQHAGELEIELSGIRPVTPGVMRGSLVIEIESPETRELRVPWSGVVISSGTDEESR